MIRRLLTMLGEDARPLRRMLAGLLLGAVLQGVGFALVLPIIDRLDAGDASAAAWWLLALVAVLLVAAIVHYVSQVAGYLTAIALSRRLFRRIGDHLAQLPLGWFDDERVGSVGRLTSNGVVDVMGMPAHLLRPLVNALVTPLTVAVITMFIDWRLGLAVLVAGPIVGVVYRWSARQVERSDRRSDDAAIASANRIVEYARAQPVLRAFDHRGAGARLLDDALVAQRDADRRQLTQVLVGMVGFAASVQATFTALLLIGIGLAVDGAVGATQMAVLFILLVRCVEPLQQAGELGGTLRIARNSLARMSALLATPVVDEPSDPLAPGAPTIRFGGVTFGYEPGRPVIEDITFSVPARTMTAIVGPSGSGKTTIARLVGRFWDADGGMVEVGGVDVRRLATEDLMAQLSFVFQDVYLFDGTIADNLRIARPDATPAQVASAVRQARVDEILERLPGGIETRVGEGGAALSGGERQRVSIARALLKDAPIVLLDEATAAIDPENEALLNDALHALTADRTLLVIAHRLQTVVAADQIVVLGGDGRVAEIGTHEQLLGTGGRYAAFWTQRTRAAGWRLTADAGSA